MSFSSALGRKDAKKEGLLPAEDRDAEAGPLGQRRSRAWCWCMCLGFTLMLAGLVVGVVCVLRYYAPEVSSQPPQGREDGEDGPVYWCGVNYLEENFMIPEDQNVEVDVELPDPVHLRQLQEQIRVLEEEQVALISVPVPEFQEGDPANIVHDFQRRLTAYLDLSLDRCYVITLNTSIVMPPRDLLELLVNVRAGSYLPQTYLVHEDMMVTERLEHVDQLGSFIYNLCDGKDTFRLQRRDQILGMQKRAALSCRSIVHFESRVVVETRICEP